MSHTTLQVAGRWALVFSLLLAVAHVSQTLRGDEIQPTATAIAELREHVSALAGSDAAAQLASRAAIREFSAPNAEAVGVLIAGFSLRSWDDRQVVMAALRRQGATALPQLFEVIDSHQDAAITSALITLGEMHEQRDQIGPVLTRFLAQSTDSQLKRLAIGALVELRFQSDEAIECFVRAVEDSDQSVRLAGLHALSKTDQPRGDVTAVLRRGLRSADPPTRIGAGQVLRQLAPQLAADLLGPRYDSTAAHLAGITARQVGRYDSPQWGGA